MTEDSNTPVDANFVEAVTPPTTANTGTTEPVVTNIDDEIADYETLLQDIAQLRDPDSTVSCLSIDAYRTGKQKGNNRE